MNEYVGRAENTTVAKALRLWPVISSTIILVGTAFVLKEDVSKTKADISILAQTSIDHEKRLIRVEEGVKGISEMKDDLKALTAHLMRRANREER